jgi:hypothetical protein
MIYGFHWEIKSDNDSGEELELLNVTVENLSKKIKGLLNKTDIIEFIPPSIFDIELHLISTDKSQSLFSELSSGEQQLVHTVQSIIYHATNVNSVFFGIDENDKKITYNSINIILDEVELYFHPEFQRKFVDQLIGSIQRINLSEIKNFNILFSTHSPFILSDIPAANILRIDKGKAESYSLNEQTFGANIHDLLHNDFFMENGFMGEFAKEKINEVINSLRYIVINQEINKIRTLNTKSKDQINRYNLLLNEFNNLGKSNIMQKLACEQIISIVGEPVLRSSLMELYSEAYPDSKNNFIDQQIKKLEDLKKLNK